MGVVGARGVLGAGEHSRQGRREVVAKQLLGRVSVLVGALATDPGLYEAQPGSLVDADPVPAAELNIQLFFRYLLNGSEPSEDETRPLVERAVSLVRDGMSLEDVLENYRTGVAYFWSELQNTASAPERELMVDMTLPLNRYLSLIMARIACAFVRDTRRRPWDEQERRRGIIDALLAGRDPADWANNPVVPVADRFLVTVIRPGDHSPGMLTDLRHRIHDLPGTFLRRDVGGWTALIPIEPRDNSDSAIEALTALVAAGAPKSLWIGVSPASARADIPASYGEARIAAELGRCLSRAEVICRRRDLRLEYAVAVDSSTRRELASVLEPLDDQPVLAETLEVFIANSYNQNAAARILCVHRNTVTYRLTRIGELTGYDPQQPAEAMTLSAARIARTLESKSFAP